MGETRRSTWATDVTAQQPLEVVLEPPSDLSAAVGWAKIFEVINTGSGYVLQQKVIDPTTMTAIKAAHPGI